MANVYEGARGDARQAEGNTPPSLFRKRYRQLSEGEVALHDLIKERADDLARAIASIDEGFKCEPPDDLIQRLADNTQAANAANKTLALRHLEDAVYRAVKALTS